ncbi:MAG TPA: hypothetical protein VKB17_01925, partial [Thermoleophilaceae bacterium]|nr:hypothetical protein [Thermoleophilaceae bacterium]
MVERWQHERPAASKVRRWDVIDFAVLTMSAPSSQGDVLVYGILNGDLIALSEGRAQQLRRIHAAIAEAATWGELRARISATDYEDFMAHFDEPPGSDEPFDGDKVGPLADHDWPEWPQQEMLDLIPKDIQQALGAVEFSAVSGDCLVIPFEREPEFFSALSDRGWCLRRDDELVRQASG